VLDFHEKSLGRDVHVTSGTVLLENYDLALGCPSQAQPKDCKSIVAKIDDTGDLRIDGRVALPGFQLGRVDVSFEGGNLDWATAAYSLTLSPRIHLTGDASHLKLSGDINIVTGRYQQEFDVRGLFFKPRIAEADEPFYRGHPLLEDLELDLVASSSGPLIIRPKPDIADLSVTVSGLAIGGTLDQPNFDGVILIEEGGTFTIPFLRTTFRTDRNSAITFRRDRRFPDETPSLFISASSDWEDRYQQIHRIELLVRGTYLEPDIDLRSQDGWDKAKVLEALVIGATSEDLQRSFGTTPGGRGGSGAADSLAKQASGQVLRAVEDPLKQVLHLDYARIELGTDSVNIKLCPYSTPQFKFCGTGDVGFATSARYSAYGELKLSDEFSFVGSVEHIEHGLDTPEDILNRGKLQLQFKWPLH
jgi:translocation-and-assembly-module (TAM) inner membrane subunit TamB-like protein